MPTKHIRVHAAAPIGDITVRPAQIVIGGYLPSETREDVKRLAQSFKEDAQKIFDGLRSLPGGTFNQLLILMLRASASSLVVPLDFREGEDSHG